MLSGMYVIYVPKKYIAQCDNSLHIYLYKLSLDLLSLES